MAQEGHFGRAAEQTAQSQWSTPDGVVHLVFATTRVDHFAQALSAMRGRGRMLVPD
jgi:hypothetical protein